MSSYVIFTDSGCDLKSDLLSQWNVKSRALTFTFEGDSTIYTNDDLPASEFYRRMRDGGIAKTAAVNSETFKEAFEPDVAAGSDILYLGFSGGLSTTANSARIAAEELSEKYPDRKIIVIDTLCASAGQGLFVNLVRKKKDEGAAIEEAAQYARDILPKLCHWFTVDDLEYLKRGGRISSAVALAGTILGIKPVLHVDDEGHLISMSKVRGRKASIKALADKFTELAEDYTAYPVYISHGDCIDDANALKNIIEERHGAKVEVITDVGPVIGAHSGPGTLALFFIGRNR